MDVERGVKRKYSSNVRYTLSTHAAEKMIPSKEAIRLCERTESGEMTADDAVRAIQEKYGLSRGAHNG